MNSPSADAVPHLTWVRNRPVEQTCGDPGVSPERTPPVEDRDLVSRVLRAYQASSAFAPDGSFWTQDFYRLRSVEMAVLASGEVEAAGRLLRNPAANFLHYGFDELYDKARAPRHGISDVIDRADWLYDILLRLAEAVGVVRLTYPETFPGDVLNPHTEDLLSRLDAAFGFRIDFPNPYPGEAGLGTSRGVAGFRALQSLHQAWRMKELLGDLGAASILEIGGGLGRTAYYAHRLGCRDYTVVDIPLTAVAQGYYLGRTLPRDQLSLHGEPRGAPVRLALPAAFLEGRERFDLVVNADSLTELSWETAQAYWARIRQATGLFLSVNHEVNAFTFRDLYLATPHVAVSRTPYWLRRGYVDEVARVAATDR